MVVCSFLISLKRQQNNLKKHKPKIFRDAHVSGHGGREDLREIVKILKPVHIIPSHGGYDKTKPMADLATELGYKLNKTCHLVEDGGVLKLQMKKIK